MFLDKDVKTKKNRSDKKNQNKNDTKLFYSYVVNKKKYLLKTYLLQNQPKYLLNTTSVFIFSIYISCHVTYFQYYIKKEVYQVYQS